MERRFPIFFFICVSLLYFFSLNSLLYTGGDNAHYLILAKSLVSGKGYRNINLPFSPVEKNFPPLFPLLLTFPVKFFGFNPLPCKIIVCLLGLASLWMIYKIFSLLEKKSLYFLLPVIFLNSHLLEYSGVILTEIPYLFFSLLGIYFLLRGKTFMSLVFVSLSFFTRGVGMGLFLSVIVFLLIKRRRKEAFWTGLLWLLFLLILWSIGWGGGYLESIFLKNPYQPHLGKVNLVDLTKRVIHNLGAYGGRDLPQVFFYPFFKDISLEYFQKVYILKIFLGVIISGIVFWGWMKRFKKEKNLIEIYTLVYFLIFLLWPWRGVRFMVPLVPFLVYYFFQGIRNLPQQRVFLSLFFVLLLFSSLWQDGMIIKSRRAGGYPPHWESYVESGEWVKENFPPQTVVLTSHPFLYFIYSERKTLSIPFITDPALFMKYIQDNQVKLLVEEPPVPKGKKGEDPTRLYLVPFLKKFSQQVKKVYEKGFPPTRIYVVLRGE